MVKYEPKLNIKGCMKPFLAGDVVTQSYKDKRALGSLTIITETSPKGKCYFKGRVFQGNPLSFSENGRVSELNKIYFRKAKKKEMKVIEKRFSF